MFHIPGGRFRETAFYRQHKNRLIRANAMLSLFSAFALLTFLPGDLSYRDIARRELAAEMRMKAILHGFHTGTFAIDPRVNKVMAQVPRHHFLRQPFSKFAYLNIALPADGPDRLMPEPFLTAMMISELRLTPGDRVLEIGFACGYESALLSKLAGEVFVIQQAEQLYPNPRNYLPAERAGYDNVRSRIGEGFTGWSAAGPYDAILVRQSMEEPPRHLLDQLAPGGRLVVPIGPAGSQQRLTTFTRTADGRIHTRKTLYVVVPPLLDGHDI